MTALIQSSASTARGISNFACAFSMHSRLNPYVGPWNAAIVCVATREIPSLLFLADYPRHSKTPDVARRDMFLCRYHRAWPPRLGRRDFGSLVDLLILIYRRFCAHISRRPAFSIFTEPRSPAYSPYFEPDRGGGRQAAAVIYCEINYRPPPVGAEAGVRSALPQLCRQKRSADEAGAPCISNCRK